MNEKIYYDELDEMKQILEYIKALKKLKDMDITIGVDTITYYAPYARIQFYTNAGKGREGTSKGGLRGKRWDRRCWNDKGEEIVKNVAKFCGGHV